MTNLTLLVSLLLAQPMVGGRGGNFHQVAYDTAFNRVVAADRAADAAWVNCKTPAELKMRQADVRAKTIAALGGLPERTPLNPQITGRVQKDGYVIEKVLLETRPKHYMTAHLFLPDNPKFKAPYPAIASPCGHTFQGKNGPWYQRIGVTGAMNGLAVLVCDPIEQGERRQFMDDQKRWSTTREHNRIGYRAALLGWSTASFRIWDGMRAFDYLQSRPDIRPTAVGVAGLSGGGTLSSYVNALCPASNCGAPAGFLSTMRDVYDNCGPQDAEQTIFGQLDYGFNHLGIMVLRAPSPVMMVVSHGDFFPYYGSVSTFEKAQRVFAMLGCPERVEMMETSGPHHWYESTRHATAYWMNRWLANDASAWPKDRAALRRMDVGFDYAPENSGVGFETNGVQLVTKTGFTLDLPGSRSVYDVMRDELARVQTAREPLSVEKVRAVCGAKPAREIGTAVLAVRETAAENGRVVRAVVSRDDDLMPIPVVAFLPKDAKGTPAIFFTDRESRGALDAEVKALLAEGHPVAVAEMRAYGETSRAKHPFYGNKSADEEVAVMLMALGENLVARRAEDAALATRYFASLVGGRKIELRAEGTAVIPAAHAWYLERALYAGFVRKNVPSAWTPLFADPGIEFRFADTVYGAMRAYDWVDLIK